MEDAGDGPAVFVIFITGIVIVPMALLFHFVSGAPMIVTMLIWGSIITGASLGLLRMMRGVMFNLQWVNKAREARLSDITPKAADRKLRY